MCTSELVNIFVSQELHDSRYMHLQPEITHRRSSTALQPSLKEPEISAFRGIEYEKTTDVSRVKS